MAYNFRDELPEVEIAEQQDEPEQGEAEYPADHEPGMKVTKGGSMCKNCEYLGDDQKTCKNEYFQQWHGSDVIPEPIDEYCSDWWEPK